MYDSGDDLPPLVSFLRVGTENDPLPRTVFLLLPTPVHLRSTLVDVDSLENS